MLLKKTVPGDLEAVLEMESGEGTTQWLGETGRAWHQSAIDDPNMVHLLLTQCNRQRDDGSEDEELLGFAVLVGLGQPGPIELRRMVINPIHRGHGYGRQALGMVLQLVRDELDRDRVWLAVRGSNTRAIALYEDIGFERCDPPEDAEDTAGLNFYDYEL